MHEDLSDHPGLCATCRPFLRTATKKKKGPRCPRHPVCPSILDVRLEMLEQKDTESNRAQRRRLLAFSMSTTTTTLRARYFRRRRNVVSSWMFSFPLLSHSLIPPNHPPPTTNHHPISRVQSAPKSPHTLRTNFPTPSTASSYFLSLLQLS